MLDNNSIIKSLEAKVITWSRSREDVQVILAIGSRARTDRPGDQWADLDLMLFVEDAMALYEQPDWLCEVGEVWLCLPHQTGDGDPELLVLFEGGEKVDFIFYPVRTLRHMVDTGTMPDVYHRGYRVVYDGIDVTRELPAVSQMRLVHTRPTQEEFTTTVNTLWYGALYVAKQIRRRELWIVKYRDWTMKESLLRMIEWHSRAKNGTDYDTWHDGRFMTKWADERMIGALQEVFGRFDPADSWRALLASMNLFRLLAVETAAKLGYEYPALLDERISALVTRLFEQDTI